MRRILRVLREFFTGRIFLSMLCLLIAGVCSFYILPGMYKNQEALVPMPRIRETLAAGELIEAKHVEVISVGAYNLPKSALSSRDDIVGRYARMQMIPGEYVYPDKVSDYRIDPALDGFLSSGYRLVTATPKGAAASLSAHLKPGDIVAIGIISEERKEQGSVLKTVEYPAMLSRVVIFDVENARGATLGRNDEEIALSSGQTVSDDMIPKTITFIVNDRQRDAILNAEYNGGFHLTFIERRAAFSFHADDKVSYTIPVSLLLDAGKARFNYGSRDGVVVYLNHDGSYTIEMPLYRLNEEIARYNSELNALITRLLAASETSSIRRIEYNEDFSTFKLYLEYELYPDGDETIEEAISTLGFVASMLQIIHAVHDDSPIIDRSIVSEVLVIQVAADEDSGGEEEELSEASADGEQPEIPKTVTASVVDVVHETEILEPVITFELYDITSGELVTAIQWRSSDRRQQP